MADWQELRSTLRVLWQRRNLDMARWGGGSVELGSITWRADQGTFSRVYHGPGEAPWYLVSANLSPRVRRVFGSPNLGATMRKHSNHYVIYEAIFHWRSLLLGLHLYLRHGHIATRGFEVLRLFEFKLRRSGRNSTLRTILRSEFGRFFESWRFPGHPKYGKREGFEFSAHDLFVARCFFKRNYSITEKTANGDCR